MRKKSSQQVEIKTLHASMLVKSFDAAQGTFEGYLSTFGNEDLVGDVVEAGAFKKTLADAYQSKATHGSNFILPILWQHDFSQPVGGFTEMREDSKGLWVRGQLDLSTELGRMAYSGLKMGYLGGLSIGYRTIRDSVDSKGVRHLLEVALVEGSVVTMPANPDAIVPSSNVKHYSQAGDETKAGRVLSADNHKVIQDAIDRVMEALDSLQDLLSSNGKEGSPEEEASETPEQEAQEEQQEAATRSTSKQPKKSLSTSSDDVDSITANKMARLLADMRNASKKIN